MRFSRLTALLSTTSFFLAAGCGGETPEPKTADQAAPEQHEEEGPAMKASAEIGALDEGKVTSTFRGALGDLQKCLAAGASRNELEGGSIAFFVKIGPSGRVVHAHAEKSTLGDRETEKCMLGALRKQSWPAPQGGDVGLARNSFDFDMPNDERPPTEWESDRVESTIASIHDQINDCKGRARGTFSATVYVDPEGAAVSAGVAPSDESGEKAADCLASALKGARYPSPGSWPAKVSFTL